MRFCFIHKKELQTGLRYFKNFDIREHKSNYTTIILMSMFSTMISEMNIFSERIFHIILGFPQNNPQDSGIIFVRERASDMTNSFDYKLNSKFTISSFHRLRRFWVNEEIFKRTFSDFKLT